MYLADHYDGAILDIMMPKMDGITVLKNIRAQGKLDVLFERFYRLDSSRNSGTGGSRYRFVRSTGNRAGAQR